MFVAISHALWTSPFPAHKFFNNRVQWNWCCLLRANCSPQLKQGALPREIMEQFGEEPPAPPSVDNNRDFRDLILRVRGGSPEAIFELVRKYQRDLLDAVRRVLAPKLRSKFDSAEFAQLVWLSFFRSPKHAARLDTSRQFVAYIIEIARHKVLMERRHRATQKRDVSREVPLDENCEAAVSREPQPVEFAIAMERLEKILKDLSPRNRQIIEMRLQGETFAEIGTKLKIDPHTACRFIRKMDRMAFT